MKRILITGENSYIGTSVEKWLKQYPDQYSVDTISVRGDSWKKKDFSRYDVVFHVAGIAHVSADPKKKDLYYKVNRDLTIEVAKKAKSSGVKQFIFMSSIIVYGDSTKEKKVIDRNTVPKPTNFYGDSKLQAEKGIIPLEDENFKVVIIRPPMIYGKGSKGNYPKLSKLACILPIFPDIDNERSMLHIDNLCEFIKLIIDNEERGMYFPQNKEYVKTSEMVRLISKVHGKKIKLVKIFNPILKVLSSKIGIINKVFGNLVYDYELSKYKYNYQIRSLEESIMLTEGRNLNKGKLDILIITDNGLDTVGGEQESTKIIINGVKDEFLVGVIQPGEIKMKIPGVEYYEITKHTRIKHLIRNPFAFILYIFKLRKIINDKRPNIIHTQAQVSFFMIGLLKKLRLIPLSIKFIHTERGLYMKYSNFIRNLFLLFVKELDCFVTTTRFNQKYWRKAILDKYSDINIDFNIIENTAGELFETYDPNLKTRRDDNLIVGFAGRYTDWKNWPLAVEISEKLNNIFNEKLIVKMAVGCLDKKSERDTIEMFTKMKSLLGERFEGKINIDISEMNKFYYDLDFFILTSKHNTESFGRTLVEAMSRKTIVLTTNSGGSVEVVGNKNNVCETADDFIKKIVEYYNNRNLMEEEKEKSFKRVREKYSLKNNVNKHIRMYKNIY